MCYYFSDMITTENTNKEGTTIENNEVNEITEKAAVEATTTQPNILSVADFFNEDQGIETFIFKLDNTIKIML